MMILLLWFSSGHIYLKLSLKWWCYSFFIDLSSSIRSDYSSISLFDIACDFDEIINHFSFSVVRTIINYTKVKWHRHLCIFFSLKHCCLVTKSCLTLCPHGLQQARLPCPSLSPGFHSYSCPLNVEWITLLKYNYQICTYTNPESITHLYLLY